MKLPIIKQLTQFIEANDEDYIIETIEVLENLTELSSLKDEELDMIGELLSNMYGALEVQKLIKEGTPQKEALNAFMKRVLGSIDKSFLFPFKCLHDFNTFYRLLYIMHAQDVCPMEQGKGIEHRSPIERFFGGGF